MVVATFAAADLVAGAMAVSTSSALFGDSTIADLAPSVLSLFAALVLTHAALGLYCAYGPCPIARLRLRGFGAIGLSALGISVTASSSVTGIAHFATIGMLLFVLGVFLEGHALRLLANAHLWGAPTVLIGSAERCSRIEATLRAQPRLGLKPIGTITLADTAERRFLDFLNAEGALLEPAEVAIIPAADVARFSLDEELRLSRLPFERVIVAEDTMSIPSVGLRTLNLGTALGLEMRFDLFRPECLYVKRLIDVVIAIPALLVAAPIIALVAIAIKLVDPGPCFYRQSRLGRDGRALRMLKLRTMYSNAEDRLREHLEQNDEARAEWARYFKLRDDPRVLPWIGAFLRRSSLDELPQLWHVVRGEMSLVGPRPFPDYHTSSFDAAFKNMRLSVPPGLTGLWQVSARSEGDIEVQRQQDLFYIRNWSIWLDIYILIETVPAVLSARGAR